MVQALYAHLWSIRDRGLQAFAEDLAGAGLNAVSYAATYHAVRQFLPAGRASHIFHCPRSHAYFLPRARYGALAPVTSPLVAGGDPLADLGGVLAARGMGLKAWVIGCHNSDLAGAHPEAALEGPLGDASPHHLCPARPAVQEYLGRLCADIAGQGDIAALELESFGYAEGFAHGAHHEMCGVPLDPFHSWLLGLCFCGSCRAAAAAGGLDAEALRGAVAAELQAWLRTPAWRLQQLPAGEAEAAFAAAHPELEALRRVRAGVVRGLGQVVRAAVGAVAPGTALIDLGSGRASPSPDLLAWADGLVVAADASAVAAARQALGPGARIGCGVYPMAPAPLSPERMGAALRGCAAAGCDGFNFYNHALLQQGTWADIRAAIASL